ncbi:hypothetical protein ACO2Q0_20570 [Phenylobacterium sp. VNQ135]
MGAAAGPSTWIERLGYVRWGLVGVIGLDVLLWAVIIEAAQLAVEHRVLG